MNQYKKVVYIFVEGKDDHDLLNLLKDKGVFEEKYPKSQYSFEIEKYRNKKDSEIRKKLKTIQHTNNPIFFFGDLDFEEEKMCIEHRVKAIKQKYQLISENIIIIVNEIESWILAGFSEKFCKHHDIEFIEDTQFVRKETFTQLYQKKPGLRRFLLTGEQKEKYSIEEACQRNQSFQKFFERYCKDSE